MANLKTKLTNIINNTKYGNDTCIGNNFQRGFIEKIADNLIANGVTIATDNNVGDKSAPTDKDNNVPSKWMTSELALAFERAKDPLPRFLTDPPKGE